MNGNLNEMLGEWSKYVGWVLFIMYVVWTLGIMTLVSVPCYPQPGEPIDVNAERENLYLPSLPFRLWVCRLDYGFLNM